MLRIMGLILSQKERSIFGVSEASLRRCQENQFSVVYTYFQQHRTKFGFVLSFFWFLSIDKSEIGPWVFPKIIHKSCENNT